MSDKKCTHNGQSYDEGDKACFVAADGDAPTIHICRGPKGWENTGEPCEIEKS